MSTLFLLFSHQLTLAQQQDARQNLNVERFVSLPTDLQQLFSNIPPDLERLETYLSPIIQWIDDNCTQWEDYMLIQGDFGATYYLVNYCRSFNYACPVYATTRREVINEVNQEGAVEVKKVFRHVRFREYE